MSFTFGQPRIWWLCWLWSEYSTEITQYAMLLVYSAFLVAYCVCSVVLCTVAVVTVRVRQTVGGSTAVVQRNRGGKLLVGVEAAAEQSTEEKEEEFSKWLPLTCGGVMAESWCFTHWQAGISSDSGWVVSADDEVALLLREVHRKLQICNQVQNVVVTG